MFGFNAIGADAFGALASTSQQCLIIVNGLCAALTSCCDYKKCCCPAPTPFAPQLQIKKRPRYKIKVKFAKRPVFN